MNVVRVWLATFAVLASTLGAIGTTPRAVADIYEDPSNHALSGTATQSSTASGGWVASLANDGNVGAWDGPDGTPLHSRTNFNTNAWWQIDLGSVKSVPEIKVWRTEFEPVLEDFSVFVSDNAFISTDITTTRNQAGVTEHSIGSSVDECNGTPNWWCKAEPFERISHGGTGRYVRVQLHGTGQLNLAEVEIGGPFDEISPEASQPWGVEGLGPSLSTKEDQEVWAIEQIGGTLYVGGRFLTVTNTRFSPQTKIVHDQPYIAAFNASNGEFLDFWRPDLDGAVFALEASADGSKLFVGGEFTNVDGIPHTAGLVALDPQTGHVDPSFRASLEKRLVIGPATVRNLETEGNDLYVVGKFTTAITFPNLSSSAVKNAIRVSTSNGAIDNSWKPQVTGGGVWGVDVDTSRNRVYLAGKFTAVNGTPDSAWFHTVAESNASSVGGLQPFTFIHSQRDQRDVVVAGDRVWVGGAQHYLQMLDASDLSLVTAYFTGNGPPPGGLSGGGDMQDIELVGDRIYITCHCWFNDGAGSKWWEYVPGGVNDPLDYAYGNAAFDAQTGDFISQFGSEPDNYNGVLGGWAIHGAPDGCVWFGGDFRDTGQPRPIGLMRQCPEDGAGSNPPPISEGPADTTKPSTPTGVSAVERSNHQVEISWNASSDNDAVAGYLLYRDGIQIGGTAGTSLRYAETPGITHSWTVRAMDPSGNLSNMSGSTGPFAVSLPAGYPSTYLDAVFAIDDLGWTYADDTFRGTSQPAYSEGWFDTTGGKSNGGVGVRLGGVDNDDIEDGMSGGWSQTFTLASPTEVDISFMARTEMAAVYDAGEFIEALVSIDGVLRGVPPNSYITSIEGTCGTCTISWAEYVLNLGTLSAGTHTIVVGGWNNKKTTETEAGMVSFDEIHIGSSDPGVDLTNPVNGGVVSGVETIGVGADDIEDADGTLNVDVRINGGGWQDTTWNSSLGVYTVLWDTTGLAEGPATVEAMVVDSDGNTSATPVANVTVNNDNQAPTAAIVNPSNGATVGATVTVRVNATDAEDALGSLDVEVNTGQGWKPTTWNAGNSRYEYVWNTTLQSDGPKTVQARATDANDETTTATSISVTVENVDVAPTAQITTPNGVVSGNKTVRVNASDSEDAAGTLDVEVDIVGDGFGWLATTWNPGNSRYELAWDTRLMPDGDTTIKARATDSANNTTNATDKIVTIDNVDVAPTATISNPGEGVTVAGTYTVRVNASDFEDPAGSLDVDVNVGNGWQQTTWNPGNSRYEWSWNTTWLPDGAATVQARATDSANNTTNATTRNVTILNNPDAAPTISITTPAANTAISGEYMIKVLAADAEDVDSTLTVEVNFGTGWVPATWNPGTGQFHRKLFSNNRPDGQFDMRARVTDSANNTTQAADVPMTISNSEYANLIRSDFPIMYYRFNEKSGTFANDSRGSNDNATYLGVNPNSTTLLSDGAPGTAARFDGNNDWVSLPNRDSLNLGGPYNKRSIELWFRADDTNGRQVLFESGGSFKGFNIYLDGDRLRAGAWNITDQDATTPWPSSFLRHDGIEAGTIYHVAVTFSTTTDQFRMYVDGELVDTDTDIGNVFSHTGRAAVAAVASWTRFHDGPSDAFGYYFDGKVDEVAIYNKTLSASEIQERWDVGTGN